MDLQLDIDQGWVVVRLSGRIDSFNYDGISSKVQTLIRMGKKHLAIDLTEVNYLGLPSLRFFYQVASRLKNSEGQLALISPSQKLLNSIEVMDHPKAFQIVSRIDELEILLQPRKSSK